jgi:hypothetical protein
VLVADAFAVVACAGVGVCVAAEACDVAVADEVLPPLVVELLLSHWFTPSQLAVGDGWLVLFWQSSTPWQEPLTLLPTPSCRFSKLERSLRGTRPSMAMLAATIENDVERMRTKKSFMARQCCWAGNKRC